MSDAERPPPRLPWDPPDNFKKRVPEGDNRERLVCDDCKFVLYQNPKIVAGSVVTWQDRILLARRAIEPRKGFWTLPAGYMEIGETTEQAARREAIEEACATIEIDRLLAVYSIARIGQVQIMYRARLASPDIAPGPESAEVALFAWDDIPWDNLAFPTVVWALAHFHQTRGQSDFATFSNPTGDLARMWPPRKPAGV
jgi:ADP-ribose pyrophosphatase YjhB (NUDIX family)